MCYFYVPWLILYYVWVFLVLGPRIKSRSYQTLYDRVVSQARSASARAAARAHVRHEIHNASLGPPRDPSALTHST
eukprot:scaffold3329_cov120-Isochrysis_galbana.AAC.14